MPCREAGQHGRERAPFVYQAGCLAAAQLFTLFQTGIVFYGMGAPSFATHEALLAALERGERLAPFVARRTTR